MDSTHRTGSSPLPAYEHTPAGAWRRRPRLGSALCAAASALLVHCAKSGEPANPTGQSEAAARRTAAQTSGAPSAAEEHSSPPEPVPMDASEWELEEIPCDKIFISMDALSELVARDLEALAPVDARFTRYLSLAQLNNSGQCVETLGVTPEATVSVFANALSLAPELRHARAVDSEQHVFALDLRDYAWDRALQINGRSFTDGWEAIVAAADLAVPLEGPSADRARERAGTTLPILELQAAVAGALQGSVYYALMNTPESQGALLAEELGPTPSPSSRAGFTISGVSQQDRLVEWWEGRFGVVYRSQEYFQETSQPSFFDEPFNELWDSSQLIYPLPNGLYAFASFDAAGHRVTSAPRATLIDPSQPLADMLVASSCMSCHQLGVIPFTDRVREFVLTNTDGFAPSVVREVTERYPEAGSTPGNTRDEVGLIQPAFARALRTLGTESRYSPDGRYSQSPGVGVLSRLAFARHLGLSDARIAGELMVTPQTLAARRAELPLALRRDGVGRAAFNAGYVAAYCLLHATDANRPEACSK